MRTRIKICGLTRPQDVVAACKLEIDAVGFVCYEQSPRFVQAERLRSLAAEVPAFITPVLLFVNAQPACVERALQAVPHALLQFHGSETEEDCARFGRAYLRAVPFGEGVDLLDWEKQYPTACALLADAPSAAHGGSGRVFDWSRLPAEDRRSRPLILAGGLTASNVGVAIRAARPYGVDVSSGVEAERGIKSEALMREWVAAVCVADAGKSG
ncbi:MAG TPA: phosphoribosylanthranilate isomerase [Burkholderiaceae bacterium]|jgi:phosphoribosylanthranilate isomerase|nr:phosphoribosylanthranilate isomerase [Burkholderiaceae bacterium]